jgi:hypothetical protein
MSDNVRQYPAMAKVNHNNDQQETTCCMTWIGGETMINA